MRNETGIFFIRVVTNSGRLNAGYILGPALRTHCSVRSMGNALPDPVKKSSKVPIFFPGVVELSGGWTAAYVPDPEQGPSFYPGACRAPADLPLQARPFRLDLYPDLLQTCCPSVRGSWPGHQSARAGSWFRSFSLTMSAMISRSWSRCSSFILVNSDTNSLRSVFSLFMMIPFCPSCR